MYFRFSDTQKLRGRKRERKGAHREHEGEKLSF